MSHALLPQLLVRGPSGQSFEIKLANDRVTIGREGGAADVGLPDPQRLISRLHCTVEREGGRWWIVDNDSRNGTFLRQAESPRLGETTEPVRERIALADGDVIRVLGGLTEDGESRFWEFAFADPTATRFAARQTPPVVCLAYDWTQGRPFLVAGRVRFQLSLRPRAHLLIRYMAKRNSDAGQESVLCTYNEVIDAVWGENSDRASTDVAQLVSEVREETRDALDAMQLDGVASPLGMADGLFETERGLGYRLLTCS